SPLKASSIDAARAIFEESVCHFRTTGIGEHLFAESLRMHALREADVRNVMKLAHQGRFPHDRCSHWPACRRIIAAS
ncbi:MAG TPA: hypothetical protein VFK10_10945, partial [Burkholderiaceae bacterium]|nr:hypothetical protein [Burkholderiaceae bacterium]